LPEPQEMLIVEDPNNKRNNAKDDADSMGDVEKTELQVTERICSRAKCGLIFKLEEIYSNCANYREI